MKHLLFWWLNPHSLLNLRCWWLTPRSSWWNHFEWSKSPTPVYTIAIAHKIKTNPPEIPESQVLMLKIHIMSDMSDVLSWFSQFLSMIFPWFSMVRIPISSQNTTTPASGARPDDGPVWPSTWRRCPGASRGVPPMDPNIVWEGTANPPNYSKLYPSPTSFQKVQLDP